MYRPDLKNSFWKEFLRKLDYLQLAAVGILLTAGLVFIRSIGGQIGSETALNFFPQQLKWIAVGLVVAVVLFMKRMADVTHVREWTKKDAADSKKKEIPEGVSVYEIEGPMFFADTEKFNVIPLETESKVIILRMHGVPIMDMSATRVLLTLIRIYKERGITLMLAHVNAQPLKVMKKAGVLTALGEENLFPGITEALASAAKHN